MDRIVPSTMASQHPDNASVPDWVRDQVISGDDEIHEAYLCFSKFSCKEVMWDAEGKDTDPYVVRKLLTKYPEYFKKHKLGSELFLTYRVPNPSVEVAERKVFLEALESIPRSYDIAEKFYGEHPSPPIFEVILPFTTSYREMIRVKETYKRIVVDLFNSTIDFTGTKLRQWIGESHPKNIEVIPLVEDIETIGNLDNLLSRFIEIYTPSYMRVFIARSDPALNYGLLSATLMAKIALSKICRINKNFNIPLYPIIGAGCLPFRGHNNPRNFEKFASEYRGVTTVTIQSAFRYDYPENEVINAVEWYNSNLGRYEASILDKHEEDIMLSSIILGKLSPAYRESVEKTVDVVNMLSRRIPARRARRLHIGLFGYSRRLGGKNLPRAIPFTAVFYSLGMPPEFIGLRALEQLSEE
ncbi:MAG TPA: phosphoenolpyruvate carboxylase, partial [Aigarchaeota archaeon]|nr:phosphoenolpyruvate carboxylase [Aigarchaeota archaeon]